MIDLLAEKLNRIIIIIVILTGFIVRCKEDDDLPFKVERADYYVATNGNDTNSGTFSKPWASLQKAFNMVNAGDTVYIRGGIYKTTYIGYGAAVDNRDGTADKPICIYNYSGEKPVFDFKGMVIESFSFGIKLNLCSYWHIKGLEIANIEQPISDTLMAHSGGGLVLCNCTNFILEDIKIHNVRGCGFRTGDASCNNYFINCDSYNNYDSLTVGYPGGNADGFSLSNSSRVGTTYLKGCKAWNNSDDGFDNWGNESIVVYDSCWAFNNGYDRGDGHGFKYGNTFEEPLGINQRTTRNCIAFSNKTSGFYQNEGNIMMEFYNNISYKNGYRGYSFKQFCSTIVTFRNNISYNNGSKDVFCTSTIHDHNSWDAIPSIIINDTDFINLDTLEITKVRQLDGSLPNINFLKLANGSDLINAGIDVGIPFLGIAPDLGPFEKE